MSPTRVLVDDDEQQLADLIKQVRTLRSRLATTAVKGSHDEFTAAATPATTYPLTYIPLTGTCLMALNGHVQREGTDYTCDYDTGIVTVSATQATSDKITFRYLVTDWLVARSAAPDIGLSDLSTWTQDGGVWSADTANRYFVSGAGSGATRFKSGGLGFYMLRADLGKASIDLTVDVNHVSTAGANQIFCAFDPSAGSGYAILWDTGSFNGGLTLYRYPSDTGSAVELGNATGSPVDTGWGGGTPFTHTVHLRLTYNSATGALAAYWGMDGATPTLRISATDATPLTGHWFGAAEHVNAQGFGRWGNWAAT